jgi:hypothetical protein
LGGHRERIRTSGQRERTLGEEGGAFYGPRGFLELAGGGVTDAKILARASNEADGRRLWEISERLTSVTYSG